MIWMSKRFKSRQIQVASSDITAALLEVKSRTILLVSVYIPPNTPEKNNVEELTLRTTLIKDTCKAIIKDLPETRLEILIAGDFNR